MSTIGTFLDLLIKSVDTDPIPVILGQSTRGYFICLPDHEVGFEFKYADDVDTDRFTAYMDVINAKLIATAVKHGIGLLSFCGGGPN